MNGILFTLNSKYIHSALAPWCLYTACKAYCKIHHKLSVSEGTVNENQEEVLYRLTKEAPDFIAFSIYIWNREKTLSLCRKIKQEKPNTIIITGGPEVAYDQKNILINHSYVDYVLSGEGEIILPELIDCLSKNGSPAAIDGVSFRTSDGLIIKNEVTCENFNYPTPYCEEYLSKLNSRIAYIESSRGCPFNCAYCLSGRCGKVKFKSIEETKKEILLLASSGTKTVKFVDRTFNCNNSHATEILRFINKNRGSAIPHDICFHFEISADILKESFIDEVSRADKGAFQFEAGIQSMNKETLIAIGRKSDLEKLSENLKKLIFFRNCHIHTDLIAGLPCETLQSFTEGFNKSYLLCADMLQLGFLKLLHGSELRSEKSGFYAEFSPVPPYEIISTPTMSRKDLDILRTVEKELDRLHNSGRFRRTLRYVLESSALTPFELFYHVGTKLENILPSHSVHLDKYINELFSVLSAIENINPQRLRDCMIHDRIATNSSGIFPEKLCISDKRLKAVRHLLKTAFPVPKNTNRSMAILYSKKRVIFCDYSQKDAVTGEYDVKEVNFDFFGETFFDFDIDK